jgi:membrane protein insertase Oxa1/YidC/SpoIIIJ
MPLFIGFISWNFPAGLIVYWATGNLFRLGQQALIFKMDGRPAPAAKTVEEPKESPGNSEASAKKPQQGAADKRRRRRRR